MVAWSRPEASTASDGSCSCTSILWRTELIELRRSALASNGCSALASSDGLDASNVSLLKLKYVYRGKSPG